MRTKHRMLNCESLENRELMAGNVSVNLVANEVRILGDNAANQVSVHQLASGAYRIQGQTGTTINGKAFVDMKSPDFDLRINLGAGNDKLIVGNNIANAAMMVEDLEIDMGAGNDSVVVGNVRTTDNEFAKIRTGDGNDTVSVEKCTIKTGLKVETGAGNDRLDVWKSTINGKLEANMGAGTDQVFLTDAVFSSSFLDGGSGTDTLKRTGGKIPTKISFEL